MSYRTALLGGTIGLLFASVACGVKPPQPSQEFPVSNFGAKGDGTTDDGDAIRRAVAAAMAGGPGSKVVFENKTYRMGRNKQSNFQIELAAQKGITLEGNQALLLNDPGTGLLRVEGCQQVKVSGFRLDYSPLPFTQGEIVQINPEEGWFDLRIENGYLDPVLSSDSGFKSLGDWGAVFDPVERHQKWGIRDHIPMKGVIRAPGSPEECRVMVADDVRKELQKLKPGDRYVIKLNYGNTAPNVFVHNSADCQIDDVTVYGAKYGMTFALIGNAGLVAIHGVKIMFKPETDRLVATSSDGFHCKSNRQGPLIEDCYFEGLLDDSINISVCPFWIKKSESPRVFLIAAAEAQPPLPGDRFMAFTPSRREVVSGAKVVSAEKVDGSKLLRLTLDQDIPNVVCNETSDLFPGGQEKMKYTGFYNLDACGDGYVVKNCVFHAQRRHAMLVRAPHGRIEGNEVDGVGGSAVSMTNEVGSFYEGPFPTDCLILNNQFKNTQRIPVVIGCLATGSAALAKRIEVKGNRIESLGQACIQATAVSGLRLISNHLSATLPSKAVVLKNAPGAVLEGNTGIDGPVSN